MVLCSEVHSTVVRISEPSDRAFHSSDLILTNNDRKSFIAKMRYEPSNPRRAHHCTASSPNSLM
ncbi:hypothetical protein RHMOL_Rhmol03G0179400 [Rhododendron molle]|uniref:Uncharacterized protein n=1 Tax=Rhododendron molle TaxID=49168 RepID=A0ACC0PGY1_RHOML|nr:hypothetical protein RHMOL_Rhmol03G0179400 [Rhododendron molle]